MKLYDYTATDRAICEVAYKLSNNPCMPLNLEEEREKFFQSSQYNPVFFYPAKPNLFELRSRLQSLDIGSDHVGKIFERKRHELLKIIEMMQALGTSQITSLSASLYGVPSPELVDAAWKLITLQDYPDSVFLSTSQVVTRLLHAMKKYGFSWKIEEKGMISKAKVDLSSKTLFIRRNTIFTNKFVNRLVVHEIGTHILRHENGLRQPYKIFSLGLTNYLATEEGLAVANEEMHNCLTRSTVKTYAARVIAVHKALKCTFRETFSYLVPYVGGANAFEITMRVKRGIGNTRWPGAFTKDYLYLHGYLRVKDYLNKGGEMRKLYYGKFGLEDLEQVERIPGLINPLFFSTMKYYIDYVRYRDTN